MKIVVLLETLNGVMALLALLFLLFLGVYHFYPEMRVRYAVPTGREVARAMAMIAMSVLLNRVIIWWWRAFDNSGPFGPMYVIVFIASAAFGAWAFLCAIRIYSKPFLGNWPWVTCVAVTAVYAITNLAVHGLG